MHRCIPNASRVHHFSELKTLPSSNQPVEWRMKVKFLGAVGVVTGSCSWLKDEERGWSFLVDCGMSFEGGRTVDWTKEKWPFDATELQFVALTHAHLDHCGLLPLLYKRGFKGSVYCTLETAEIAKLVLADTARQPDAPYGEADVARIRWRPLPHDKPLAQPHPVATDLFLRAYRSGHIVGAVSFQVLWGARGPTQRSIVFSGDVGPGSEDCETSSLIRFPWRPAPAHYAVLESTYGAVVRPPEQRDPQARLATLESLLTRTVETGGTLLLPAFALGRTQDVLFELHYAVASNPEKFADLRVVLDAKLASKVGPIAAKALGVSEVTGKAGKVRPRWLGKQFFKRLDLDDSDPDDIDTALSIISMTLSASRDAGSKAEGRGNAVARNWKPLVETLRQAGLDRSVQPLGPTVIVCGSADGESGAAAQWLPTLLRDARNTVANTGYCPAGSAMAQVVRLAASPPSERKRHTGSLDFGSNGSVRLRDIGAELTQLKGLSAHADQHDLVNWFFYTREGEQVAVAPKVFIQHGEDPQRRALKSALADRAVQVGASLEVMLPGPAEHPAWFSLEEGQ
jgi:metallo-beta-lactamase family protein